MADNPQGRARVNVDEPHEPACWTGRFGVSADATEQALRSRRDKV
ncbi:DUF3606 domain-containing protein [Caulobacter sp. LjRoot300]